MKLSQYAKQVGVTYKTAYRWWKDGKLDKDRDLNAACNLAQLATASSAGRHACGESACLAAAR